MEIKSGEGGMVLQAAGKMLPSSTKIAAALPHFSIHIVLGKKNISELVISELVIAELVMDV